MLNLFKHKTVEDEFEFKIPLAVQDGQYDCRYEVYRSLDKYYNGSTQSVAALRESFPDAERSDSAMAKMYSARSMALKDITEELAAMGSDAAKAQYLIALMRKDVAVIAEFPIKANGRTYGHAVGVKTVKTFSNGKVVVKVMNPSGEGGSKFTSLKDFTRFISVTKF